MNTLDQLTLILNKAQIQQKIERIAHEIYENHYSEKRFVFVAIEERGVVLANRLAKVIASISEISVEVVNFKIDKKSPLKSSNELHLDATQVKTSMFFLIDDVLNSGKTLMHAAARILSFNVKELRTIILVDRTHRRFPIRADYAGLSLSTTMKEHIQVDFSNDNEGVYLTN
jgi:pyrimidine operon attenuation protein/uracil phosphoribosyltransferase